MIGRWLAASTRRFRSSRSRPAPLVSRCDHSDAWITELLEELRAPWEPAFKQLDHERIDEIARSGALDAFIKPKANT